MMRKVVKIIITERAGGIRDVGVKLSHIDKNLDLMTAAVGFVQSIAHSFEVKPRDIAEKMVEHFNKEEAADVRSLSGGAGAVSQEREEEK